MGNWLFTKPGSSVDIVKNPIGQRDDKRRDGEKTEREGRNRAAVGGYNCSKYNCKRLRAR